MPQHQVTITIIIIVIIIIIRIINLDGNLERLSDSCWLAILAENPLTRLERLWINTSSDTGYGAVTRSLSLSLSLHCNHHYHHQAVGGVPNAHQPWETDTSERARRRGQEVSAAEIQIYTETG